MAFGCDFLPRKHGRVLAGKAGTFSWGAVYHDFSAATGSGVYGEEIDFLVAYRTLWGQQFGLKAALYDAKEFATDTDKLWFWTSYSI